MNALERDVSRRKSVVRGNQCDSTTLIFYTKTRTSNLSQEFKNIMAMSLREFRIGATELVQKAKCSEGRVHSLFLVPNKFKAMRYINDPRTVPSWERRDVDDEAPLSTANVIFDETTSSRKDFALCDISRLGQSKPIPAVRNCSKITGRPTYLPSLN